MSQLILGMQCAQDDALARDPARQRRLADLVVDPRWHYAFKLITSTYVPGLPTQPAFSGPVATARMHDAALEALASDSVTSVMFSVSKKDALDHAHFNTSTGRGASPSIALRSSARCRIPERTETDAFAAAWVELQHAIVETVGGIHGVIVTATNEYVLNAEVWLSLASVDGKVMHPRPDEISSYAARAQLLGHDYVRRPRWGTYLKPAHVAAIGGRAKLVELVNPPVVRDVGELLYVQLTERVSDATSDAARQRYRAFAELLAPITMPPA